MNNTKAAPLVAMFFTPNIKIMTIAENLFKSANGYGLNLEDLKTCIESIPEDLLHEFLYTMSRIAEKSGFQALNGDE